MTQGRGGGGGTNRPVQTAKGVAVKKGGEEGGRGFSGGQGITKEERGMKAVLKIE